MIAHSPTLAVNEMLDARAAAGETVVHLGFGEARLPVLPEVAEVLAAAAPRNRYAPVAGSTSARTAAAGYFTRRGTPTEPDQVVLAPGSKPLLYALIASLPGDVVLPRPSWVSYAAQAALAGRRVVAVPAPDGSGGVPDPHLLDAAVRRAQAAGRDPGVLVLTLPDNPTGRLAGRDVVARVCEVAGRHGLAVVSDEIYRDLCYEPADHASPAALLPDRCFVTGGLSKSVALGGWRIGFARFPDSDLGERARRRAIGVASEVWSCLAEPMQAVAAHVLDDPPGVTGYVAAARRLHRAVTTALADVVVAAGARCPVPQGAFYAYLDLAPHRAALARRGVTSGAALAEQLLSDHGVGVLPGRAFGDDPAALRVRAAASLLYGRTDDERWAALRSPEPAGLPWISDALERVGTAFAALTG
ncbi:MAG TPA: pyridoxal phosphate-dependent aminotransferase [Acidimicrobiales bacterium]